MSDDDDEFSEDLPVVELPAAVARWFAEARAFHRAWREGGGG